MMNLRRFFFVLLTVCCFLSAFADRPKIGLALSGGGAKGAAAIGALKVIEEAGVKVDYIAGTSIGAVIGALYASGYTTAELEEMIVSQNLLEAFQGHRVEEKLKSLLAERGVKKFKDTTIPFCCVAVDIDDMSEVLLANGSLHKAVLASMSIPEIYEPVEWKGMRLADGGLLNNLPVDVVRDMGADIVIAIDLQQGKGEGLGFSPQKLFGLGGLIDWVFTRTDKEKYEVNSQSADIYIHPDLGNFTAFNFGRYSCRLMLKKGEDEAREHWEELMGVRQEYLLQP